MNGEALHALNRQRDVCRNLIRIWIKKYEHGEYDYDAIEADLLPEYEAWIATLLLQLLLAANSDSHAPMSLYGGFRNVD